MKILTRNELGMAIRAEAEKVVLSTSLLFVLAGSLWAHFALGPAFLEPAFLSSWALIHALGFVALKWPRLWAWALGFEFFALQLYFFLAFQKLSMPFVPLAPVFFVVTQLVLTAFVTHKWQYPLLFWVASWSSVAWWMQAPEGSDASSYFPIAFAGLVSFLVFGTFSGISRFFSKRLSQQIQALGPAQSFDDKRINAAKLQIMGELTASLVHEINNPLTNINGYSYQISETIRENDPQLVTLVKEANERISFNVDRIKDITRAVKGFVHDSTRTQSQEISSKKVFEDSLLLIKHHIKSAGIDLQVHLPSSDYWIAANSVELSQVLVNLLGNARDAVKNADRRKISVGISKRSKQLVYWVEDTGPGIPESLRQEIFKPFFTTKALNEGTGLGLYISKLIADRNKAVLDFETLKDPTGRVIGTRFELVFSEFKEKEEFIAA